jgi:hypothetical protein
VGLAGLAGGVYALIDERCELTGSSGICLRGDRPNVGIGVLFSITGGLAIAGAIIWLFAGGIPGSEMQSIDIVLSPEGGGFSWRSAF